MHSQKTYRKKLFEVIQLVSKVFLGVDFEKSHEYTLEKKNSLNPFGCFEHFCGVYITKIILSTPLKNSFEVVWMF